jgi:FkbM family methyltransferase
MRPLWKRALRKIAIPTARIGLRALTQVFDQVATPDGQVYTVNRNIHPFDYLALKRGIYEKDERGLMRALFTPDESIIDIGANIGVVASTALEEKLVDGGHIVCVEPNPKSLYPLRRNMERAVSLRPLRSYEIVERAVSAQAQGHAHFRQRDNLSSGLATSTTPNRRDKMLCVQTVSLSDLVNRHATHGASLICDAEGAEIDMIRKEPDAFGKIRQIVIELHEPSLTGRPDATPDIMAGEIEKLGFKCGGRAGNTFYFAKGPR